MEPADGSTPRSITGRWPGRTTGPVSSLWIDDDGQVLYATRAARRWLASEDTEPCPAGPPRISTAVAYRIVAEERRGTSPHVVLRLHGHEGWASRGELAVALTHVT